MLNTTPLLVVDVQPMFDGGCAQVTRDLVRALNASNPPRVVWYYVSDECLDGDCIENLQCYLVERGLDEDVLDHIQFVGKDYGFLRQWMDTGISEEAIIKTVQLMKRLGVIDSRDLERYQLEALALDESIDELWEMAQDAPLWLPSFDVGPLLSEVAWQSCGGGEHECLKEMEIFAQAAGVQCERLDHLVYGH